MRQPYWKPQHEVFIRCMLQNENPTKAYQAAYPKASTISARVGGARLYSYPHIRQRIEPILQQRHEEATRLAMEQALAREIAMCKRRDYIRGVLCQVVNKQVKKNRCFRVNGETITLLEDVSHATMLQAIMLDLQLAEGYNRWGYIESRFAQIIRGTTAAENSGIVPTCKHFQNRQQPVTNSAPNPIQATVPSGKTAQSNNAQRQQPNATIKPSNPTKSTPYNNNYNMLPQYLKTCFHHPTRQQINHNHQSQIITSITLKTWHSFLATTL